MRSWGRTIKNLCSARGQLDAELTALPARVPVRETMNGEPIVRLERERKIITDTVKMVAYRAETQLANLVGPLLPSRHDEARKFMRQVFELPADLLPNYERGELVVRPAQHDDAARQSRPGLPLRRAQRVGRLLPRHRTQAGAGGHTSGNRVAIIIGVCPGL